MLAYKTPCGHAGESIVHIDIKYSLTKDKPNIIYIIFHFSTRKKNRGGGHSNIKNKIENHCREEFVKAVILLCLKN